MGILVGLDTVVVGKKGGAIYIFLRRGSGMSLSCFVQRYSSTEGLEMKG